MMELMVVHPHIFWLSLGGLLLAAEMLGGNGYLLWSGVAAVITGLVVWLLPLGWEWQGVMFCRPDAARRLAVVEMVVAAGARTKAQRQSFKPARAAVDWPTFCSGISAGQRARSYARR